MKKLKLFLTLLLLCAGVNISWAQITVPETAPVTVTTVENGEDNFALGTKWYRIQSKKGNRILATSTTHSDANGLKPIATTPGGYTGHWCVTGNNTDGYTFYNRAEGTSKVLAYTANNKVYIKGVDETVLHKTFDFVNSIPDWLSQGYFCLRIHGSDHKFMCIDGGAEDNTDHLVYWDSEYAVWGWEKNSSNATGDEGSAWKVVEVGMEVELCYIKEGQNFLTERMVLAIDTPIEDVALEYLAEGHIFAEGATFGNVVDGKYTYEVFVTEVSATEPTPDYSTPFDGQTVGNQTNRYTSAIGLTGSAITNANIEIGQENTDSGTRPYVYDKTHQSFRCYPGEELTPVFEGGYHWNNGFVYVDENKDGFHVDIKADGSSDDIDATTHKPLPTSDLKSFSFYAFSTTSDANGYNSAGEYLTGDNRNTHTMPSFVAPSAPGKYRMRYKVDWSSLDPNGQHTELFSSTLTSTKGRIIDVTLEVLAVFDPASVATVLTEAGEALNKTGVGYPANNASERTALQTLVGTITETAVADRTEEQLNELKSALNAYYTCEDIEMPKDGKVYTFQIKAYNNKLYNVYENGDESTRLDVILSTDDQPEDVKRAQYMCHKEGDKFVFVSYYGDYMEWCGVNNDYPGFGSIYNADWNNVTLAKLNPGANSNVVNDATAAKKLFGCVYFKFEKRHNHQTNDTENTVGIAVYQNKGGDDDIWSGDMTPYFNTYYTSAAVINEVADEDNDFSNSLTFKQASDGMYYATFYGRYPIVNPSDATPYYVTGENNGYLHLQQVQHKTVITRRFPVIFISDNDKLYLNDSPDHNLSHLHVGLLTTEAKEAIERNIDDNGKNMLQGTILAGQSVASARKMNPNGVLTEETGQVYVLSGGNGVEKIIGFYPYSGETLPQHKAYYVGDPIVNGGVRGFKFDINGVETKIELNPETASDAVIYDLSGRRVSAAKNGLFIINGKKVIK